MLHADPTTTLDPASERSHRDAERRLPATLDRAQRRVELPLVLLLLAVAAALPLLHGGVDLNTAFLLVPALALAYRIEFPLGAGSAMPTQLVFVPLLLTVPPATVPACVATALLLGRLPDVARGQRHRARLLISLNDAWYAVAPALVVLALAPGEPSLGDWHVVLLAFGAQVVGDGLAASIRMAAFGIDPRSQLRELSECWITDLLLTPVGFAAALATTAGGPVAAVLVLPLGLLLQRFARERQARLSHALVLSETYRRIALLLGDVIGDDDEYTGDHSQGVVALAVDVADELGLDEQQRQLTELGALLHDVGKIQVRWDGGGYPDGLAGDDIPLAARIVACCDAFSAMTTDRSYRKARPLSEALAELRACAGTHFDPRVAEATCAVIERRGVASPASLRLAA
jgi:HD-GYP domain-containing protein (c-di-GMP phosphodiesterase class II)